MFVERLVPSLDLLRQEYVLVQAWKKTAAYIRYHNWYADTLALDRAAVNLPAFLGALRERLAETPVGWKNTPLRIVPAPKGQRWHIRDGAWEPAERKVTSTRLRPLAHASLDDQVLSTALMLCLADRVETLQGDTRSKLDNPQARRRVVSYGNRLFCDTVDGELRHRWGSSALYRAYYQDYRTFISRPQSVVDELSAGNNKYFVVVQADLRQFYDRVRPSLLASAVDKLQKDGDDPEFFGLAKSLFDWRWDGRDDTTVGIYAKQAGIDDFSRVALPQGLVASGFFANIVLLPFDDALRGAIGSEIGAGVVLEDVCRYVDDLRILVSIESFNADSLGSVVSGWLGALLNANAAGLALGPDKTKVATLAGEGRPLMRQSEKMKRIQAAVSGGFDALAGEEILDAIEGLMRPQVPAEAADTSGWKLAPVPDVRDETVARFGAARYRTTFRSIRPLLQHDDDPDAGSSNTRRVSTTDRLRVTRTQGDLDEDAHTFALGLVQRWIEDPANVRLLRVGLDLWPDAELLREVLELIRPYTVTGGRRKAPRRVAWYCLAEVLRAGATETGIVNDGESLPANVDVVEYRKVLCVEASRLVELSSQTIPWYLRQQALLVLAVIDPNGAPVTRTGRGPETRPYRELIRYLRGEGDKLSCNSVDFAVLAILARRSMRAKEQAIELAQHGISAARVRQIAQRDPSFFLELFNAAPSGDVFQGLPARIREDLCIDEPPNEGEGQTLTTLANGTHGRGSLRNELSLLCFARAFLTELARREKAPDVVTPAQVQLQLREDRGVAVVEGVRIFDSRADTAEALYQVPDWCAPDERWRFQLGFLLRFALSGQPDYTRRVAADGPATRPPTYRRPDSHWYQRLYGLYSGQPAFGDDWLPITEWLELLLLSLLRWPGCRNPTGFEWVGAGIGEVTGHIERRISELERCHGKATGLLLLPLHLRQDAVSKQPRPLRTCVVQTVLPMDSDFEGAADLRLDDVAVRRRHRNHLSATLAAVERALTLRATHKETDARLDWLILPELAVHPDDVRTHLVPFARAHGAMILAGLTYQELWLGEPLVNSAIWVIPERSDAHGLQIRTRRQGKAHLAPNEDKLSTAAKTKLQGFRPCQWLVGYPWAAEDARAPLWLTAAICYDATDLGLAADLRYQSDVLAIPAFNKDVKTFDQMALALHYHMFQLVIVANNGQYGGSNAYWPRKDSHERQVFHIHGQPQASMVFFEINDIDGFLKRRQLPRAGGEVWKYPPAGKDGRP